MLPLSHARVFVHERVTHIHNILPCECEKERQSEKSTRQYMDGVDRERASERASGMEKVCTQHCIEHSNWFPRFYNKLYIFDIDIDIYTHVWCKFPCGCTGVTGKFSMYANQWFKMPINTNAQCESVLPEFKYTPTRKRRGKTQKKKWEKNPTKIDESTHILKLLEPSFE